MPADTIQVQGKGLGCMGLAGRRVCFLGQTFHKFRICEVVGMCVRPVCTSALMQLFAETIQGYLAHKKHTPLPRATDDKVDSDQ